MMKFILLENVIGLGETWHGRMMRRCGLALSVVMGVIVSSASGQNLLKNPDLEGLDGFTVPAGWCMGEDNWRYSYQCIPEIEPPTWWYPFWDDGPSAVDPDVNYRRPEFRVYAWPDGPHYPYSGSKYLVYFGFYGAIDAGIYQQVNVATGSKYEFSYQGFAWSNCMDGKEYPSGAGCNDFPADQAVMKAGIDPHGGTDYASASIVWSAGDSFYDAYQRVAVSATAANSTITVFVRCAFWHNYIQHNDMHVDALSLVRVGPEIGLSESSLTHTIWIGDPSPASDVFTVANVGSPDPMSYQVSANVDWVGVAPMAGVSSGEADPITVNWNVDDLRAGEYSGQISVTSDDAINDPATISLGLNIQTVAPDADGDGDVDLEDFGRFQACYTGAGVSAPSECAWASFDTENDVDADDFGIFQACLSGANILADRNCAE